MLLLISGLAKSQVTDTAYVNDTVFIYDTVYEVYSASLKNRELSRIRAVLTKDSAFFREEPATFHINEINSIKAKVNGFFSPKKGSKMKDTLKKAQNAMKRERQHTKTAAGKSGAGTLNPERSGKRRIRKLKYYAAAAVLSASATIHPAPAKAQGHTKNKPKTADTAVIKKFPGQISFFYPLGSSGKSSRNTAYHLSVNILTGVTGAVNGAEFGGIANINKGNMKGAQFAGINNISLGTVAGAQFAGIANISKKEAVAAQFAGIANIAGRHFAGAQFGGIANLAGGEADGLQVAGILNDVKGVLKGVQIGLINKAGRSRGLQLGLINCTDTVESGFSFGLINLPRHGFYDEVELSFSDYANTALSYKFGSKRFYTIVTAGTNYVKDHLLFFGAGFGHIIAVSPKFWLQPEILSLNYFPDNFKNTQYNSTNRIELGLRYNFSNSMAISLAPSIYTNVLSNIQGSPYQVSFIRPVSVITGKVENVELGFGFSIGLIFY